MLPSSKKDVLGYCGFIGGIIVVVAFIFLGFKLSPAPYNADTLCLKNKEPYRASIIIDKTDPYGDSGIVEDIILQEKQLVPIHGRLTIYVIDETGDVAETPLFDLCNPGRGDQVNALYRNPRRVETRYNEQFDKPLKAILEKLKKPGVAPQSPIAETLAEIMFDRFAGTPPSKHKVVLISDLLQNSDLGSAYQGSLSLNNLKRLTPPWRMLQPSHTHLRSVVLNRPKKQGIQRDVIDEFWQPWLEAIGVEASF